MPAAFPIRNFAASRARVKQWSRTKMQKKRPVAFSWLVAIEAEATRLTERVLLERRFYFQSGAHQPPNFRNFDVLANPRAKQKAPLLCGATANRSIRLERKRDAISCSLCSFDGGARFRRYASEC